jgi:hypothetical protein
MTLQARYVTVGTLGILMDIIVTLKEIIWHIFSTELNTSRGDSA